MSPERLELLAVVRGLEALEQPSKVTLVTTSRVVRRGLRFGLELWRENQWHWERFGRMAPIKNADLWQRVDRALHIHDVSCRTLRFDEGGDDLSHPLERTYMRAPQHEQRQWQSHQRQWQSHQVATRASSSALRIEQGWLSRWGRGIWTTMRERGRRLVRWCGLCRFTSRLVIAPH